MGALLSSLLTWLAGDKAADILGAVFRKGAYIAAALAAVAGFVAIIDALMVQAMVAMPAGIQAFAQSVLPRNLGECVGIMVTATIARAVMRFNAKIADKVSS